MKLGDLSLSVTTGVVLAVAVVLQASVLVIGLVVLARTPADRVHFGRKWPWVLIMLASSLVGTVVFLAAGRRPAPAKEAAMTPSRLTSDIVNSLYQDGSR